MTSECREETRYLTWSSVAASGGVSVLSQNHIPHLKQLLCFRWGIFSLLCRAVCVLLYSPVCEEKAGDGERDAGQAGQEKHLVGHHWRSETWQVRSEDQSESVISLPPSVSVA